MYKLMVMIKIVGDFKKKKKKDPDWDVYLPLLATKVASALAGIEGTET